MTAISGNARLLGILVVVLVSSGPAAKLRADDEKAWTFSQERNPVKGGIIYQAQAELPELRASVRCSSLNPLIDVRFFMNRDRLESVGRVRWQFDGGQSRAAEWPRSANGRSLILPTQSRDRFLNQLRVHNFLYLTLIDTDGDDTLIDIPLSGSSAAIARVKDHCR